MSVPDVSLVVPVRDEAGNIGPLVGEIRTALDAAGLVWELFFVDDGSTDGSAAEIAMAAAADGRVQGLPNDRGRGKSAALMAGFARCRGDRVVMLDGDGQDDPAEIPRMLSLLGATPGGVGLVNGWKSPRLDPWHKTLPSKVFNLLVGWVTGLWLHDHNCGLKAFRGDLARSLVLDTDMHRFIPVLAAVAGQRVVEVPVRHRPRTRGVSKYGVGRFFRGLADLVRVAGIVGGRRAVRSGAHATRRADSRGRLRRGVFLILAVVALAGLAGRIGAVASVANIGLEKRLIDEAVARARAAGDEVDPLAERRRIEAGRRLLRPFLSANDRSRWLTIRALVERGTFAIDDLVVEPGWDTIDAVAHPDAEGRLRLYSSKPPLLAVLCAVPYWLLHRLTGWTLGDHPFALGRLLLAVCGLGPLAVTILFTSRLIEVTGRTDWGRIWSAALISLGTLLTTFAVVLTNHVPAAACVAASGWLVRRIDGDGVRSWRGFAAAGLTAALAAALELPALAWLTAVLVVLVGRDPGRTVKAALPAALVVAVAAVGSNWVAHGTVVPAYAHRAADAAPQAAPAVPPGGSGARLREGESWNPGNWYDFRIRLRDGRLLESYWRRPRAGDQGEPSAWVYAWHALVGHHGIFSLTPAWLLVAPGVVMLARRGRQGDGSETRLALAIATVSVTVLAFYLLQPQHNRNYGGMSSGFRWVFWLAPLWVVAAVPAVDRLAGSRGGRALALALLALSIVSVSYPTWNPWTPPWIENWLVGAGSLSPR